MDNYTNLNIPDTLIKLRNNLIRLDSENGIDMLVGDSLISIQKGIKRVYYIPTHRIGEFERKILILGDLFSFLVDIASQNMGSSPKPLDENTFFPIEKEDVSIARELSKQLQFMNFNGNYIDSQLLNGFQSLEGDCFVSIYRNVKQLHFIPREELLEQRLHNIRYPDWDNVVAWMRSKGIGEFKEDKKGLIWWVYDKDAYDNLCTGPLTIWWAKDQIEREGYNHFKDEYKISRTRDNCDG